MEAYHGISERRIHRIDRMDQLRNTLAELEKVK